MKATRGNFKIQNLSDFLYRDVFVGKSLNSPPAHHVNWQQPLVRGARLFSQIADPTIVRRDEIHDGELQDVRECDLVGNTANVPPQVTPALQAAATSRKLPAPETAHPAYPEQKVAVPVLPMTETAMTQTTKAREEATLQTFEGRLTFPAGMKTKKIDQTDRPASSNASNYRTNKTQAKTEEMMRPPGSKGE